MKRATGLIDSPTASFGSAARTAGLCPRFLVLLAPDDSVTLLRARHEAQGLRLNAHTATPGWLGEPLDVGWAIDVLHPLAG